MTDRLPPVIVARVFLPFAAGYFLSYLFRVVNAVLAPALAADVGLSPSAVGFVTGAYFLAFAAAQVPLGMALDRFGPRRTQTVLLTVAAAGALAFSRGDDVVSLAIGRAIIGAGVSGCLLASFKAFALWFPKGRLPLVNGLLLGCGGLGAIAASSPVEALLGVMSWQGVFQLVAAVTLAVALALFLAVPERRAEGEPRNLADQIAGLRAIVAAPVFWSLAPLVMVAQSAWMSTQALWFGPWLRDVAGLDAPAAAAALLMGGVGMTAGYVSLGALTERLGRRGVPTDVVAAAGTACFVLVQFLIAFDVPLPPWSLTFLFAFFGGSPTLFYAGLTQHFPVALAGRVNTSLALLAFSGAFACQTLTGLALDFFPDGAGGATPLGYGLAFGTVAALQVLAFAWLGIARSRRRG